METSRKLDAEKAATDLAQQLATSKAAEAELQKQIIGMSVVLTSPFIIVTPAPYFSLYSVVSAQGSEPATRGGSRVGAGRSFQRS